MHRLSCVKPTKYNSLSIPRSILPTTIITHILSLQPSVRSDILYFNSIMVYTDTHDILPEYLILSRNNISFIMLKHIAFALTIRTYHAPMLSPLIFQD